MYVENLPRLQHRIECAKVRSDLVMTIITFCKLICLEEAAWNRASPASHRY